MPKNCEQCSAPLAPNQTFCRQCGSLTGDSGNDPTVMLCRPRPDASSPWAKVGTVGTLGAPNGRVAQTSTLASGNSAVVSPFIAHQQSLTHSDPAETEILDGRAQKYLMVGWSQLQEPTPGGTGAYNWGKTRLGAATR